MGVGLTRPISYQSAEFFATCTSNLRFELGPFETQGGE